MRFVEIGLAGVFVVEPEFRVDERGFFARTSCPQEFAVQGLAVEWVQSSIAYNHRAGTLRGMHWQAAPHEETKLVRCTMGAAYDVILDLRPESETYLRWVAVEITAQNRLAVYIPAGCAHGYQTLTDATELFYQISEFHHPEAAQGVRWDDPAFGIAWPTCPERVISARDASFPDYSA